jgi:alpha-galactosidase
MTALQVGEVVVLRSELSSSEVVIACEASGPVILHWGQPLGDDPVLPALRATAEIPSVPASVTWPIGIPVVPAAALGWDGRPGMEGARPDGTDFAPTFTARTYALTDLGQAGVQLTASCDDDLALLGLEISITLVHALEVTAQLANRDSVPYHLNALRITLPLADQAAEILRLSGHWIREFDYERVPWPAGAVTMENRRGRTSHEAPPVIFVGQPGWSEWHGEVWGAHLAWSGNHQILADRLSDGRRYLQLGELLLPGEIRLDPGQSYRTPAVVAVHSSAGLTPTTWGFHRILRARPTHPSSARPVTYNTWEATYFDHDADRLLALVEVAAAIGIERFVLDDGWFGGRRSDRSGLGDWRVSSEAHPGGLGPLIDAVRRNGMEFGIWVEPEMVNPDSDLFRDHPDWVLTDLRRAPILSRSQLVLDLDNPECFAHIFTAIDALLRDHEIRFVKWDMNRPLVHPVAHDGAAGAHRQTMAVYRLLDQIRAAHPTVEFESCASGGGRIDHAMLQRVERVWTSDCNDPLERQRIQRGASLLIPPEMMGAHVGPMIAHTTGRTHQIGFAGITAMFGHFGVEADLLAMSDSQRSELAEVINLHKDLRPLLHHGDSVRFDIEEPWLAHGVYATDRLEAVICCSQLATSALTVTPVLRCPGLFPEVRYQVSTLTSLGLPRWRGTPSWERGGELMTGAQLAVHGLRGPLMHPASVVVVHLRAVDAAGVANVAQR